MIVLERDGTELEIELACLFQERGYKDLPFDILADEALKGQQKVFYEGLRNGENRKKW